MTLTTVPGARACAMLALGLCLSAVWGTAQGATCNVSSTGLAFGAYQPVTFAGKLTSADKTSTATVTVSCTGLLSQGGYSISLGAGSFGSGDRISTRYLNNNSNGGALMAYNIYTTAGYTTVWGNGASGSLLTGSAPLIPGSSTNTHTVYGRVPAGQTALRAGSYSDSLTMTISYSP
ncbi:MAG: spore coat U domain-containing protein [Ramlibacter sp.]